jgi:hypothetical protein
MDFAYSMFFANSTLSDEEDNQEDNTSSSYTLVSTLYIVNCAQCKLIQAKYHWYLVNDPTQCGFYNRKNYENEGHEITPINYVENQCYECKERIPHGTQGYFHEGFHKNICNKCQRSNRYDPFM